MSKKRVLFDRWSLTLLFLFQIASSAFAQSPVTTLLQVQVVDPPTPTLVSIIPPFAVEGSTVTVILKGSGYLPYQTSIRAVLRASAGIGAVRRILDDETISAVLTIRTPSGTYYIAVD